MNIEEGRKVLIEAIKKVITEYDYAPGDREYQIFSLIFDDKDGLYLSLSDEFGKVTYAKSAEDKLNPKKRVKTSLRRFIRRQLNIDSSVCSDSWLDRFGCKVLSNIPVDLDTRVKVLRGNDIVTFYANTFIHSCMTGRDNRDKITFYSNNPDKVGLAVMDNFVRAFVWKTDEGINIFDRVYPAGNIDAETLFRKWASSKGYLLRSNPSSVVPTYETVGIQGCSNPLHVSMNFTLAKFPYLDTFRFGKFVSASAVIISNDCHFGDVDFVRTNGLYTQSILCHKCGTGCRNSGSVYTGEYFLCKKCWDQEFGVCYSCRAIYNKSHMKINPDNGRYYCTVCFARFEKSINNELYWTPVYAYKTY